VGHWKLMKEQNGLAFMYFAAFYLWKMAVADINSALVFRQKVIAFPL
jgi:hypothetical protein